MLEMKWNKRLFLVNENIYGSGLIVNCNTKTENNNSIWIQKNHYLMIPEVSFSK